MPEESLEELLERINEKYQTSVVPVTVSGRTLRFLQIKDLDEIVFEQLAVTETDLLDLPFWGKIWEAGIFLAAYLAAQPVVPERRILEIGAGVGVSGLFAAAFGHQVTLSDYQDEILDFTRANALLNDLHHVPILKIDWREFVPREPYDCIVGSEVVYHRPSYDALVQFLDRSLAPGGTIFLAKSASLPASGFFSQLTEAFKYKKIDRVMRSEDQNFTFSLYAIKRKRET